MLRIDDIKEKLIPAIRKNTTLHHYRNIITNNEC